MTTKDKPRCPHTLDIVDDKTDEERRQEKVKKAVEAAWENLRPFRKHWGIKD